MAAAYYREAIDVRQPVGGRVGGRTWAPFGNLAYMALMEGDVEGALPDLQASLRNSIEVKTLYGQSAGLLGVSLLASLRKESVLGARLLGATEAIDASIGYVTIGADALVLERAKALVLEALGDVEAERQMRLGAELTVEAAVREAEDLLARSVSQQPDTATRRPGGLSPQEYEVLRRVAAGYTNREIAGELVLSVRTVENHIANAYGKIGARGRAEATAWAIRNGLGPAESAP